MSHAYQPPHQPQPGQQPYGQPYPPQPYAGPMVPQRPMPTAAPKSGGVALILSFLVPGLGHLYTGNPISAVIWFAAAVLAWVSLMIVIGFVLIPLVYIGAMIHAYVSATNFNRRHHAVR